MVLTRVVHCRREPYGIYIGRPSPWGNPFVIGRDGDRVQVVARYDRYLDTRLDLLAMIPWLRGRVLGCFCAPQPCHGDVLARRADAGGYLPPGMTCTGYWYAVRTGMITGSGDEEFLHELGVRAARLAARYRLPVLAAERPELVPAWPEWIWARTADAMARAAAETGDYGPLDVPLAWRTGSTLVRRYA